MKRWQILGLSLWGTIVFGYLGTFLGLRLWQTRLIFRPNTPVPALTPADLGWTAEAVTLSVPPAEGTVGNTDRDSRDRPNTLQGWWFPPQTEIPAPAAPEDPTPDPTADESALNGSATNIPAVEIPPAEIPPAEITPAESAATDGFPADGSAADGSAAESAAADLATTDSATAALPASETGPIDRQALILFLGRRKTMADHWQSYPLNYRISALLSQTPGLLMVDYRGYGQSPGPHPTEAQLYADGEAAWQFLRKEQGIPAENIFLYGYSLGSAVALELALRHPDVGGVILDGAFTTLEDALDRPLAQRPYLKIFPLDLILTQTFDNYSRIAQLQAPLLIIHGTADEVVPVALGQALFAAAPQPKEMLLVRGAGHETTALLGGDQYLGVLKRFFNP